MSDAERLALELAAIRKAICFVAVELSGANFLRVAGDRSVEEHTVADALRTHGETLDVLRRLRDMDVDSVTITEGCES